MSDDPVDPMMEHLQYLNRAVNVIYGELGKLRVELENRQDPFRANLFLQRARLRDQYGEIRLSSERPVAIHSPDHVVPWGTARDNSINRLFNAKLSSWISPHELSLLDFGCSGGGSVRSFIEEGILAVGLEGSDFSLRRQRAEWATIPEFLFTADITAPFTLDVGGVVPYSFAVITAWEVMEHIHRDDLNLVLHNMAKHLRPSGVIIMSISTISDVINGVELHQTIEGREWWLQKFEESGFSHHENIVKYFGNDFIRWEENAQGSFHVVLTRVAEKPICLDRLKLLI